MVLPDWRTFSGGTMKKAALWLAAMVGEGEIFTKDELRDALPGVSQIDRRVRDLRDHGWIIHTRSEDLDLELNEQRLVHIGAHVWSPEYRLPTKNSAPTSKQRREVLESSNHRCVACGATAGEPYFDDILSTAKLTVTGSQDHGWIAVCQQCKRGGSLPTSLAEFQLEYSALTESERDLFAKWTRIGSRESTPLDRVWDKYRHLGQDARSEAQYVIDTAGYFYER